MTNPQVLFRTNYGDIQVELFEKEAPETVANFLQYVDEKHYDNTIFHRVIDGFMVQAGGYSPDMKEKTTRAPIKNEAENRVANARGTLAMARTSEIHSGTAQFFINVADNEFLNFRSPDPSGYGYCVFGKVVNGMDTVDKIRVVSTTTKKGHQDVPVESVTILSAQRVNQKA